MSGFAAMQNDRIKALLDDTSSLLYQVAQSLDMHKMKINPPRLSAPTQRLGVKPSYAGEPFSLQSSWAV